MTKRPFGLTYENYAKALKSAGHAPLSKADYDKMPEAKKDEDTEDEESEDEESEDEEMGKGSVDVSTLLKSIQALEDVVGGTGAGARKRYLASRMAEGTITKAEQGEFETLVKGGGKADRDTISKSMIDDPESGNATQELFDASPFFKSLVDRAGEALSETRELVERQGERHEQIVKAMVSVIGEQGKLLAKSSTVIDALGQRLGIVERTPGKPRAVTSDPRNVRDRQLNKAEGEDVALRKSTALTGLRLLAAQADKASDLRALDQIITATARVEAGGGLSKAENAAVRDILAKSAG